MFKLFKIKLLDIFANHIFRHFKIIFLDIFHNYISIAVLERLDMTPVLQQSTRTKGFEAISCAHPVTLELRHQLHLQQVFVPWHCR